MTKFRATASRLVLTLCIVSWAMSAVASAKDLSRYRNLQLGTDLPTVAKQAGSDLSQVRIIHSRPALIQELQWRPRLFSSPSQTEAVQEVVIDYHPFQIAGLTAGDMIEAISARYGICRRAHWPGRCCAGALRRSTRGSG